MRRIIRMLALWLQVAVYIVHSSLGAVLIRSPERRQRFHARTTSFWAKFTLWFLGVHVTVKGREHLPADNKVMLVSNHLGYLDIIVISSVLPTLYITSREIQKTFFLGFMSTLGGSLFVDRRSKSKLLHEIRQIGRTISSGNPVMLFPEGTSSNGDGVLPFKMALFAVAEQEGFAVAPMCVCYNALDGVPVSPANRDRLYYYGDLHFFPHLLGLPSLNRVDVTLEILPAHAAGQGVTRKDTAERCYTAISQAYARNKGASAPAQS